eukprot:7081857-Karenia_brevis.AAC.1
MECPPPCSIDRLRSSNMEILPPSMLQPQADWVNKSIWVNKYGGSSAIHAVKNCAHAWIRYATTAWSALHHVLSIHCSAATLDVSIIHVATANWKSISEIHA